MGEQHKHIEPLELEAYVLGQGTPDARLAVEQQIANDPQFAAEFAALTQSWEAALCDHPVKAPTHSRKAIFSLFEQLEAEEKGQKTPPILNPQSKIEDYAPWLDDPTNQKPESYDFLHFEIIDGDLSEGTAIVWLDQGFPEEIHTQQVEKFLIVEGSCDIIVVDEVHEMQKGDYISIPLHKPHAVRVTSEIPCKIILQRLAVAA